MSDHEPENSLARQIFVENYLDGSDNGVLTTHIKPLADEVAAIFADHIIPAELRAAYEELYEAVIFAEHKSPGLIPQVVSALARVRAAKGETDE